MHAPLTLARIESLFRDHGTNFYGGESITQTEHALQCAMLAEEAGEADEIVVAALLHDIGHLLPRIGDTEDLRHQEVGARALSGSFAANVTEPIRLHVAAKRYLCSVDDNYWAALSPASKGSLVRQGGPYSDDQAADFARQPYAQEAVRVRQYDDKAKVSGAATPPLSRYLKRVELQLRRTAHRTE